MVRSDRSWSPTSTDLDWIEATGRPLHPMLTEMEGVAEAENIPILSRDSGRMLAVLAANRRRIVEVGTAIGYSTLWMALALPSDGTVVTIDPDRARTDRALGFWRRASGPAHQRRQRARARGIRRPDARARRAIRHGLHRCVER